MNGRAAPSRHREFQENLLSIFTITVDVTYFFLDEHNRDNHLKEHNSFVKSGEEQSAIFFERFLRSYRLLDFIACRVLGDKEKAPIAVQNCWRTASRNRPRFEYEGAFRSWLVRILIDEALAILREKHGERNAAAAAVSAVSRSRIPNSK
jgi:Sigma-70 region 2